MSRCSLGGERRKDTAPHRSPSVSRAREFWQHTMLPLWEVSRAVIGSVDFLLQEPLRASGERKAWVEPCGGQDVSGRGRGGRQEDQSGGCHRNP